MNTKEMIVSIATAMLVMTMFASSAMAITVDGDSSDWSLADKLCDDEDSTTAEPPGYNITSLWACIVIEDEKKVFYARMDMFGVTGDADGDGDDDTDNLISAGDWPGVGVGADDCTDELYWVKIDGDNNGGYDYTLKYCLGESHLYGPQGVYLINGATTDAAHGEIVELSVVIDDYCDIQPTGYCVKGWADTQTYGGEDNVGPECRIDEPPTAKCSFDTISCGQGTLSGKGSSADVVKYSWDFDDDGTYDVNTTEEDIVYDTVGTRVVRLMVTDDLGQTANCTLSVTLTCGPIADAKADGSDGPVQLPSSGKLVTFCGDESYHPDHPDANITSYHWTILGVDYYTTNPDECFKVFIDGPTTASLRVVDDFDCEHTDWVTLRVPIIHEPPSDVPIMTPTGIFALIGMLCIVGAGRILTKGRRS